jgi:hypothetical protein
MNLTIPLANELHYRAEQQLDPRIVLSGVRCISMGRVTGRLLNQ